MSGSSAPAGRPLWRCGRCGRTFANVNQPHACRPLTTLDAHFARSSGAIVAVYRQIEAATIQLGPFSVLPEVTRVAWHVRMSFAAFTFRRTVLHAHVVLARRLDSGRFRQVTTYSPRNHVHEFAVTGSEEVDAELLGWFAEAYRVGEQRHLGR